MNNDDDLRIADAAERTEGAHPPVDGANSESLSEINDGGSLAEALQERLPDDDSPWQHRAKYVSRMHVAMARNGQDRCRLAWRMGRVAKRLKAEKPHGNTPDAPNWEDFCPEHFGCSARTADNYIAVHDRYPTEEAAAANTLSEAYAQIAEARGNGSGSDGSGDNTAGAAKEADSDEGNGGDDPSRRPDTTDRIRNDLAKIADNLNKVPERLGNLVDGQEDVDDEDECSRGSATAYTRMLVHLQRAGRGLYDTAQAIVKRRGDIEELVRAANEAEGRTIIDFIRRLNLVFEPLKQMDSEQGDDDE